MICLEKVLERSRTLFGGGLNVVYLDTIKVDYRICPVVCCNEAWEPKRWQTKHYRQLPDGGQRGVMLSCGEASGVVL